jgi:ADP-ribose pyrophosphatase
MTSEWPPGAVAAAAAAIGDADARSFCLRVLGMDTEEAPVPGFAPDPVLEEMVVEIAGLRGLLTAEEVRDRLPSVMVRAIARARGRASATPVTLRRPWRPEDATGEAAGRPYAGFFALEEHVLRHRRFDGSMSPPLARAVFASGDAVTVLPYDPRRDAVLLIEQFRAGPFARRDPVPWRLEAIAGRCDAAEDPEATARREAREEAGLELGRMERALAYYPTPAIASEYITSFVAEADLPEGGGGVFGLPTENEDIRAFVVPRAEAETALKVGEVDIAPLALSLLWLTLNVDRLRREWAP